MNLKITKVAFNNVMKHKRRSTLNALTFASNMAALLLLLGLLRGVYNSMIDKNIDLSSGHLAIYNEKYVKDKDDMPLRYFINEPEKLIAAVRQLPHVKGAAARIIKDCTISDLKNKTGVMICAVDMDEEKSISTLLNKTAGSLPAKGAAGIVVGKRLADLLKDGEGKALLIYGQTVEKANNLSDAALTGIYSAGFGYMERNMAFVDLKFGQRFFDMDGKATQILVRLDDKLNVGETKEKIRDLLKAQYPGLAVRDWMEESPELIGGMTNDVVTYALIFCILIFLSISIIVNTMTISVFERMAEIGTLRAIGFEKSHIREMFFTEGIILVIFGIIAGAILVSPLIYQMNMHGFSMGADFSNDVSIPFDPVLKSINRPVDWLICAIICLAAGIVGSIFPANRAAKTNIVEALKRGVR